MRLSLWRGGYFAVKLHSFAQVSPASQIHRKHSNTWTTFRIKTLEHDPKDPELGESI